MLILRGERVQRCGRDGETTCCGDVRVLRMMTVVMQVMVKAALVMMVM